jgi:hypothetical protein
MSRLERGAAGLAQQVVSAAQSNQIQVATICAAIEFARHQKDQTSTIKSIAA